MAGAGLVGDIVVSTRCEILKSAPDRMVFLRFAIAAAVSYLNVFARPFFPTWDFCSRNENPSRLSAFLNPGLKKNGKIFCMPRSKTNTSGRGKPSNLPGSA